MADTKHITLYAAADSPFPHRVRLALEEIGVKYDTFWIEITGNKQEWYAQKVYPAGKVPYLVYGGKKLEAGETPSPDAVTLPESIVILEFLADAYPSANLLPADPALRAKARLFYLDVDSKLLPAFFTFVFLGAPLEPLLQAIQYLQSLLPEEGFVLGQWSIADAALLPLLLRLELLIKLSPFTIGKGLAERAFEELHSPGFARIQKYIADSLARPNGSKTWDEEAVKAASLERLDRIRLTGKINHDVTVPIPGAPGAPVGWQAPN